VRRTASKGEGSTRILPLSHFGMRNTSKEREAGSGAARRAEGGAIVLILVEVKKHSSAARQPERRRAPRVQPSRSARLLDVSPLGVAIETATLIEKGRVYDLILALEEHRMPVSARAVHVRHYGDVYRASFAFDRILDSDRERLQQTLVREVADRMTIVIVR
jgi:hypothetical protein